ncbi:hypothetical protein D0T50_00850 [Bacteroides sp. 214]|nr:hypothetical protein [Bacteroides sp. 214]
MIRKEAVSEYEMVSFFSHNYYLATQRLLFKKTHTKFQIMYLLYQKLFVLLEQIHDKTNTT